MKHCNKMTILSIRYFPLRFKREAREVINLHHLATTLVLVFSMASLVISVGVYFNIHVRKYFSSPYEDFSYYPIPIPIPNTSSPPHKFQETKNDSTKPGIIANETQNWVVPSKELTREMTDKELFWRATLVPRVGENPCINGTPKVAFMFLTKGKLPLAPLWEMFFKGHEGLYSIYIHKPPELVDEPPETSVFYRRRISSKSVQWGRSSMIDAERRLLANALLDFSNQRFILLSETCIPLFNFSTTYNYLINSGHSFLGSFDDPRRIGRGRYNKRMAPAVKLSEWRKGSQWFEVRREVAVEIVSDVKYYPVFRDLCKPPCYMDEHYLPTIVTKICPEANSNRSVTWVDWSGGGSHPTVFFRKDVTREFLVRLREGSNCSYNGGFSKICFLFARKFHPSTLEPLLRIAPGLIGFN